MNKVYLVYKDLLRASRHDAELISAHSSKAAAEKKLDELEAKDEEGLYFWDEVEIEN